MRKLRFCVLAVSLLPVTGPAQATTLAEALAKAYERNPSLAADREGLKVLDEDVATARSGGRPNLSGEANLTRSEIDVRGTGGIGGVRMSLPLFRGGKIRNSIRAAESNVLAGRESLRQNEIDLFYQVVDAYSGVLRDREIFELNEAQIGILDTIRAKEQRRLDLGERTITDVSQSEARLSGVIGSTTAANQQLAESKAHFAQLVGEPADGLEPLPPLPELPPTKEAALAMAVEDSPRVRQAVFAERVAQYQVKAAKGALMPTLDASAAASARDEIVQILGRKLTQNLATFQLLLTVPFFQGGGEYSAVRRAKHVASVRLNEVEEARRAIEAEVHIAWDGYQAARVAQEAYRKAIMANEKAVAGVRREALAGTRTTLDILDAERELRDARIAYANARHDEYLSGFRLAAALGRTTATQMGIPVKAYDPEEHYRRAAGRWIGFDP